VENFVPLRKLANKIIRKVLWILDGLVWYLCVRIGITPGRKVAAGSVSIGIATFKDRYWNCLVPLLRKLAYLFPKSELIVVANGHVRQEEQKTYLSKIHTYCSQFDNIKLIVHQHPVGLSAIWNQIIRNANNDLILILNDDVDIKINFPKLISQVLDFNPTLLTINKFWSHFVISKPVYDQVGDFDEGLLEIGGEDDDYAARMALNKIPIGNVKSSLIAAKLKLKDRKLKLNGYGKNMSNEANGYSSYNSRYLAQKWLSSDKPFDGAVYVPSRKIRYWKLRG